MTFQEKLDQSYEAGHKEGQKELLEFILNEKIISEEQADKIKLAFSKEE